MPDTHFVGEILRVDIAKESVSVTWAIVPGNAAWLLKNGQSFGESQTGFVSETAGIATINHPIDVQYESSSAEGWPLFVCEIWDRAYENGARGFLGCGCIWLPTTPGEHCIDVFMWMPTSGGLEGLSELLLPSCPDLRSIRELTVNPYMRSQLTTEHVGVVKLKIATLNQGLVDFGVQC